MKRLYVILIFIALAVVLLCVTVRAFSIANTITYDPPGSGVGRVQTPVVRYTAQTCVETGVETGIDTTETETPENRAENASETVVETEEEYLVEVIPDPEPIVYTDIDALIVQVAGEYGLPWELVRAVCYVESTFNPNAVSPTGDYGLMQVYYGVWNELGVDLKNDTIQYDPEYNLRVGCGILKEKIEQNGGDFTTALMCYNRGDSVAHEQWSAGIYATDYTNRVLTKYYEYLSGGY